MSIINDALKKVQARLEKNHKKDKSPEPIPSQSPEPENVSTPSNAPWAGATPSQQPTEEPKRSAASSAQSFFLGLLIILLGAGIIYALYAISSSPGKIAEKVPEPVKEAIKAIPVQEAIERVQKMQEPEPPPPPPQEKAHSKPPQPPAPKSINVKGLALNGIMMIEGRYVALINNIIYEHGDEINGMTITDINQNVVELRNGKQVVELKLTK